MPPPWHSFYGCALQLDTLWLLGKEKQIIFIQKVPFLPRGSIKAAAHLGGPCGGQLSVLAAGSKCGLSRGWTWALSSINDPLSPQLRSSIIP